MTFFNYNVDFTFAGNYSNSNSNYNANNYNNSSIINYNFNYRAGNHNEFSSFYGENSFSDHTGGYSSCLGSMMPMFEFVMNLINSVMGSSQQPNPAFSTGNEQYLPAGNTQQYQAPGASSFIPYGSYTAAMAPPVAEPAQTTQQQSSYASGNTQQYQPSNASMFVPYGAFTAAMNSPEIENTETTINDNDTTINNYTVVNNTNTQEVDNQQYEETINTLTAELEEAKNNDAADAQTIAELEAKLEAAKAQISSLEEQNPGEEIQLLNEQLEAEEQENKILENQLQAEEFENQQLQAKIDALEKQIDELENNKTEEAPITEENETNWKTMDLKGINTKTAAQTLSSSEALFESIAGTDNNLSKKDMQDYIDKYENASEAFQNFGDHYDTYVACAYFLRNPDELSNVDKKVKSDNKVSFKELAHTAKGTVWKDYNGNTHQTYESYQQALKDKMEEDKLVERDYH